jgi:hypothetical protein
VTDARDYDPFPHALKAERELDALVAEKVMGIAVEVIDGEPIAMFRPGYDYELGPVKPYSTDIAAAWELVETLSFPLSFELSRNHKMGGRIVYVALIIDVENATKWWADSSTAPHAIALAFLKARGTA